MQGMPKDSPQEVQKLTEEALSFAEKHFGPRNHACTLGPHFFLEDAPEMRFFGASEVRIRLSKQSGENWFSTTQKIGHEALHVLNPQKRERDTNLEEGCACWLANSFYRLKRGQSAPIPTGKYERPYRLVRKIMSLRPDLIKELRSDGRSFADIDSAAFSVILTQDECTFLSTCLFE